MSIKARLNEDLKQSMKQKDSRRTSCIRMLKSRLLEREVELRAKQGKDYEVTDDEAKSVISTYAKQRRDSISSYKQGGRDDLVAAEQAELDIVTGYLPAQLTPEQLHTLVSEAITESGAASVKDLGKVMKIVVPRTKGVADGKLVSQLVRGLLAKLEDS